ncbi:barstar family protein [Nocardia callitridis]|uniref:Barstar (barnase inhibitor) domain-containing protein n=1 Tax=Nocardia callitridis TaxID=648753 RepID=A0ABP9JS03_9NOCA
MTATVRWSRFLARPAESGSSDGLPASESPPAMGSLAVNAAQLSGLRALAPSDYLVRELRGTKMRTVAGVFDEFAAAFQFGYYFGENKDAFDECLRDLDDFLGTSTGYLAVIRDSAQLLADDPDQREWFGEAIGDGADYWWRRDTAFRVVLQGEPAGLRAVTLELPA